MDGGARRFDPTLEWLEADGLGGFAMGTAAGHRTRRYHGLLCAARTPPVDRRMLVPAVEAWIDAGRGPRALTTHRYTPDVSYPDGASRLVAFTSAPWPTWTFELEDGLRVVHEVLVPRGSARVLLSWSLSRPCPGARLAVRPLLAGRDVHALAREATNREPRTVRDGECVRWIGTPGGPAITALASGPFQADACWYRGFLLEEERARGYDHVEDLWSPGTFTLDPDGEPAVLWLAAEGVDGRSPLLDVPARRLARETRERERARRAALDPLDRAAEAYLVRRGPGQSIVAGYPWFGDWGRDTFLSLRGLLLARGRATEAAEVLETWAAHATGGLLPNRFPDDGGPPEDNSVDAALWFVVAVAETLAAARDLPMERRARLARTAEEVVAALATGTRHGIRVADDGLLACGAPGTQLTWMDARVGIEPVTPRVGKPVEVQALWIRALEHVGRTAPRFAALAARATASFEARFWNETLGFLNDVVDVDHVPGTVDPSLRPNQLLALGGLGPSLVEAARTRRALETVEGELWTPVGPRTLSPRDARYRGVYRGDQAERDRAYHQGTAWSWLAGPFVEAWVRSRGSTSPARAEARRRFVAPLRAHLATHGLGHVSEVADGDAPHRPGGCPFQAWSLAELLRLERVVLATGKDLVRPRSAAHRR